MCFMINRKAKRWKRVTAYKVVNRTRKNDNFSEFSPGEYTSFHKFFPYKDNGKYSLPKSAKFLDGTSHAFRGFYVYKDIATVEKYHGGISNLSQAYAVIKVRVDPKDFLFASHDADQPGVATYRKIQVISEAKARGT